MMTMTKIREMSWIFFVVLILAFVGLMVFEWGMDASGMKGRSSNVIGQVYNVEISYPDFERTMRNAFENEKNQTGEAPSQERIDELKQNVWDQLIRSIILQREVEKREITVSDDEVILAIKTYFKTNENFLTDGLFDEAKWQQALTRSDIPWAQIESQFRSNLPINKLEQMIVGTSYIGEAEIRETAQIELTKFKINQLGVRFSEFENGNVQVDSTEILSYYEDHLNEFKQDEQRQLSYAVFELIPTKEDTLLIYNDAKALIDRVKKGENINSLAKIYSDEPSAKETGGDLGWFTRGRMVKPFEDAVFSNEPGDILGPIKTNFGYHVIQIIDRRINDTGEEEFNVSHILLNIRASRATEDLIYSQVNALIEMSKESDFMTAANDLRIEIKQSNFFSKNTRFIPGIGNIPGASLFAYSNNEGDVSRSYQTPKGYYVLSLNAINEKGHQPLEQVKPMIVRKLKNSKYSQLAKEYLETTVKPLLDQGKTFQEISSLSLDKNLIYNADQSFNLGTGIPGIGRIPESYAQFIKFDTNKIEGPITGNFAAYFIEISEKTLPTEIDLENQEEIVRKRILTARQGQYYQKWYQQKLEEADIKDYRADFNLI